MKSIRQFRTTNTSSDTLSENHYPMTYIKGHKDDKGNFFPAQYGLLDVARIVKLLDKEFAKEITDSKRIKGEYAIKDNVRLEYRSLPASAFFLKDFDGNLSTFK